MKQFIEPEKSEIRIKLNYKKYNTDIQQKIKY